MSNIKADKEEKNHVFGNNQMISGGTMSEIMNMKSGFLESSSLYLFLLILMLLLLSCWFIKYPEVINAKATLVATNVPKEIIPRLEGRLIRLYVSNNSMLTAGQIIGVIESSASVDQIIKLNFNIEQAINEIKQGNYRKAAVRSYGSVDSLGELQDGFRQFSAANQSFTDYLDDGYYMEKRNSLLRDLENNKKIHRYLEEQRDLIAKDLQLSEETYSINEKLLKDKVLSKLDDRIEQSKLIGKKMGLPQVNTMITTNEGSWNEKKKEIAELDHLFSQQKTIFNQAVNILNTQINEWKRKYILVSPVTGYLDFVIPLQINQILKQGKVIGYVNPGRSDFWAEVNLGQYNVSKVKVGQQVQLRFDAYPYKEFGYVKGKLNYITDFATDSGFMAKILLTDGMVTNMKNNLQYHVGLKADVLIITKDMRLLDRLLFSLTSNLK